ncbi:non-ribosomal peptide synthetase, partial [Bacillus pseudomycoides]
MNHKAIQEAAVVPLQDSQGDSYLCAYYVPIEEMEEAEYTESSLRSYLSIRLPEYMMPSAFCQLEKLPLTVNGKLDTAALPVPDRNMDITKEYVPPQNETERKLSVIWKEVLGIEEVGRFDHFFECGGHSLKAMLLVSRITREFEVPFQIKDVFHSPVLYQMGETIEQMNPEMYVRIEPVESRDFYPVSSAQQRIHVASQLATEAIHYNVPLVFEIEGDVQKERLVKTFEMLIKRHEALRTSFHMKENTLVQCIHNQVEFLLEEIEGNEENVPKLLQQFVRPFDLTKPLLMRAGLLEVDTKKRLLLVDLHHIITDGMSTNILLQELVQLYQKPNDLEPLRIQYKDYAVWQQEFLQTEGMKRQEAFWLEKLEGELPILELPTDFPRPSVQQFEGAYVDVRVNRETTEKLQALTKEENGTLYMTLLAAYNVLLARYTGQEDFIVGTPIAGRPHEDLEPIVGMFVNTLAMRNKLANDKPFREFLQEVRENVLKSYEHQMYPLEDLIEKLKVQRDMSRNPLFDTIFTLQNMDLTVPQGEEFMLCPYPFDYQMSKVDV